MGETPSPNPGPGFGGWTPYPPPQPPYPPSPYPPSPVRRLYRRADNRVFAGVASGIADYLGTDPVWIRLAFVVTCFLGPFILTYPICWLVIPKGPPSSVAPGFYSPGPGASQPSGSGPDARLVAGVVLLIIAALVLAGSLGGQYWGLVWGAVLVIGGVVLLTEAGWSRTTPAPVGGGAPPAWPPAPQPAAPVPAAAGGTATEADQVGRAGGDEAGPAGAGDGSEFAGDEAGSVSAGDEAGSISAGDAGSRAESATSAAAAGEGFGAPSTSAPFAAGGYAASSSATYPPSPGAAYSPYPGASYAASPGAGSLPPPAAGYAAGGSASSPTWAPAPRSRSFPVGLATTAALMLVIGIAALLDNLNVLTISASAGFGLALLVIGVGLIVGAWFGRSGWLIFCGLFLLPFAVAASFINEPLTGGTGQIHYAPQSLSALHSNYRLIAGQLTVDLSQVDVGNASVSVTVSDAMGQLVVDVPPGTAVDVRGSVGAGELNLLGHTSSGVEVSNEVTAPGNGVETGTLHLNLSVGLGQVTVQQGSAGGDGA